MTQSKNQNRPTAFQLRQAILNGKKSLNGIKLPSPQTTGTTTQQIAYATQQADKLFNSF
jgi:hypothetical protein